MSANDKQVGGDHYDKEGEQHWDRIYRLYGRGYFVGCATKYIERYHLKNGKQDLEKAIHFIEKLIELEYGYQDKKYPDDYQEQLASKMEKMREDAMIGIPEHLRDAFKGEPETKSILKRHLMEREFGPFINDAKSEYISPMLKNFWGGEEAIPQGYVNQDGPDV